MPVSAANQMISGARAVAQVAKQRLALYFGEWWEDERAGFRLPALLSEGVREENVGMLASYIAKYVSETQGATSVDGVAMALEGRKMTFGCTIHVGEESEELEVELDGLLSAEY